MCDCEAQERKIAAVRAKNAATDAQFNRLYMDKYRRDVDLNGGASSRASSRPGAHKHTDCCGSDSDELTDDEYDEADLAVRRNIERLRKLEISQRLQEAKKQAEAKSPPKVLAMELNIAFRRVRQPGERLVLFHTNDKRSKAVLGHMEHGSPARALAGTVDERISVRTSLDLIPLQLAYVNRLPCLVCYSSGRIVLVNSKIGEDKGRDDEDVLEDIDHWIEKLTTRLEARPNPVCGRRYCKLKKAHTHTCEKEHKGCSHLDIVSHDQQQQRARQTARPRDVQEES